MKNLTMFAAVVAMVFCAVELNAQCGGCGVSAPVAAPAPVMTSYVSTSDCNTCCQPRRIIRRRSDCCNGTYTSSCAPTASSIPATYAYAPAVSAPVSNCCPCPTRRISRCCPTTCATPAVNQCCWNAGHAAAPVSGCGWNTNYASAPMYGANMMGNVVSGCGDCASGQIISSGAPMATDGMIISEGIPVEASPVPAVEGSPVETPADATGDNPPTPDDA